jgi:MHS family proline/betaine transporter-like MFS transporter
MNSSILSKKNKRSIILAVTLGNFLEWYEIYLYVYWAPILSKQFFDSDQSTNMLHLLMIFGVGFLARPFGGLFFGRLGDRIGRRKALILSVLSMIFPTTLTGLLPTHDQIGIAAPILLAMLRILQSFPAGGELPGAFCYLYEISPVQSRRFMCSWAAVGYQLGILFSILECFLLEEFLSPDDIAQWGWRISFIIGGCIGFFGLCLRARLHETPLFREMATHERIVRTPIFQVLGQYKKKILLGILFCALNSSSFYFLSINFPTDFGEGYFANLLYSIAILLLITLPLPFFGILGDRYDNKKMLIGSTIGILILLVVLCLAKSEFAIGLAFTLFCLLFTLLSALIPFIVPDLFPTRVRFTCVALSFNLADAIIGGFTPAAALYLTQATGTHVAFYWILFFTAILSLTSYIAMAPPLKKGI